MAEPLVHLAPATGDETLAGFLRRRFGVETGMVGASSLLAAGVYAGDPEWLSARAAFPYLVALADSRGSMVLCVLLCCCADGSSGSRPTIDAPSRRRDAPDGG